MVRSRFDSLFVYYVGAFFALTVIYMLLGQTSNVFWETYIKTIRYYFLPVLPLFIVTKKVLKNKTAILIAYGTMLYLTLMTILRIIVAILSKGDYLLYRSFLINDMLSLYLSILILSILICVKILNKT